MLFKVLESSELTGAHGCQIKEDLKTMSIKEDLGACTTSPFAQTITAKNFQVSKKAFR